MDPVIDVARNARTARPHRLKASSSRTFEDGPATPTTGSELRAQRLGSALRGLAAELVDERRKVAHLRREIAELRARFEALESARPGPRDPDCSPANDT